MSLFPSSTHRAIKSGIMTLTFRLWDSCKLKKGRSYTIENLGRILIKDTQHIPVSSISDNDAHKAGYKNSEEIYFTFQKKKPDFDPKKDSCFRIEFQFINPKKSKAKTQPRILSKVMLDKLDEKLKRLDRRAQGITYSAILKEMSKTSCSRLKKLVTTFDCEFQEMRRKLNRLIDERLVEIDPKKRFHLTARSTQLIKHRETKISEFVK